MKQQIAGKGIHFVGGVALAAATALAVACSAGGSDKSLWQAGQPPPSDGSGGAGGAGGAAATNSVGGSTVTATTTVGSTTATTTTAASTTVASSTSVASSSSSSGGGETWTELYNGVFGQSGTSTCNAVGGCHQSSKGGFTCGTTKTTCYNGFVSAGWITPGASASQSPLVDPSQSCLCGSLGGNMPRSPGHCPSSTDVQNLKSWLATGAPDN
jgi:hypothetical protein